MNKRISVIIPVYCVRNYLDRCIQSVINQSYKDLEIILIDDGSTDGSAEICDKYGVIDSRIKVLHQKNQGVAVARNVGLRAATGEILGFVDSDDYLEKEMIEKLFQSMQNNNAQITIGGYKTFGTENGYRVEYEDGVLSNEEAIKYLCTNKIQSFLWNKLFFKDVFSDVEFPSGLIYEDVRVMHRLFLKAHRVSLCSGCAYNYNIRDNSITGSTQHSSSQEYINSLEERCRDLSSTEYFAFAKYGEFKSIRRIVYEMIRDKSKETEFIKRMMKEEKTIYKDCCRMMSTTQKTAARLFLLSPRLYTLGRKAFDER